MDKYAVHAHRQDFNAELYKFVVLLRDRGDFGRSNKGEITRVATEDHPLPEEIG
jgi:hypothetical protein